MMKHFLTALPISLLAATAGAQNFNGGFNFYLPPTDTASTRFIPQFLRNPLTDQDFVSIDRDGHFSVRGKPIRFFGTNLVAGGAFPTASKAWFIAGRLRKMGFNLVRFHHMDNPWSVASLFEHGRTTRQLNTIALDRLENVLSELKKNGVYADINLHVGRTFNGLDGLPDADSLQDYGKGINYFDPEVLALHKEFARQLLTHVSPYTGKALVNDPVMGIVEITNENSLYRYWHDGGLKSFAEGGILTSRHTKMLDTLWLSFLKSRYASTSTLASAWSVGSFPANGINRLVNGTFEDFPPTTGWVMEIHQPANASVLRDSVAQYAGKYSAKVAVSQVDGMDWHLQWKQIGLSVTKDTLYLISFAGRSDSSRWISVSLMKDDSPWTWYGGTTVLLTPQWETFSFGVRAPETANLAVRLSFTVGGQVGAYWFDDISLTTSGVDGLLSDESYEASFVRRIDYAACAGFTDQRVRDMSSFYIKLQDDYFAQMRGYLKDTLSVKVPIVGTNWNVGPADMVVQSKLDYIDDHAYWDHPRFPSIPWSSTDWYILNTPMVQTQDGGTVARLMAGVPIKGKPFTISEYNHAFPNRYQSEALLFITAYSSFHDADGLMFFEYSSSVDDWETDEVGGYFSIDRNSAMMSLVPSCAKAYRTGMISKAQQTLLINYAPDDYLTLPRRDNSGWSGPTLVDRALALRYGIRTSSFTSATPFNPLLFPPAPGDPYVTDTKEISWNTNGLLTVASERFVGAAGILDNFSNQKVGPLTIKAANGFGTITWISLTSDSVQRAPLSLLTVSSKLQNSGMVWDGTTTVHDNWGGSPTQVAPLLLTLQVTIEADSIRVYPIDAYGRETRGFSTYIPAPPDRFNVVIDQNQSRTMWFGIEKFGSGVASSVSGEKESGPYEFRLEQNFPNPFNPSTTISYELPRTSQVRLTIMDLLGREVAVRVNEREDAGRHSVTFDGKCLSSGVYFYQLAAGDLIQTRKLILLR